MLHHQQPQKNANQRRNLVSSSPYSSNSIHSRNPWVIAWWSAAFPGFGHLACNSYLLGFILMTLEYILNDHIQLNMAIYFSMIGEFEQEKQTINVTWFFAYIAIYVFAIWDSYRRTVDLNKAYQLAYKETKSLQAFQLNVLEVNPLEKKKPWVSFIWSFIMPGLGHLYLQRIPTILYSFFWWGVILYFSKLNHGIVFSLVGEFEQAKSVINVQWLLFIPSIYGFSMYNAYALTVENNKLFEIEQSRFLKNNYQKQNYDDLFQSVREG